MNYYNLNSKLNFGKYKGKDLVSVIKTDVDYVYWCLVNIDTFAISDQTITDLYDLIPELKIPELAENFRKMKLMPMDEKDNKKNNLIWVDLILSRIFSTSY
jgi:hypothetical protein